jgi:hypothetical protein
LNSSSLAPPYCPSITQTDTIIKGLTGSSPEPTETLAGTTHDYPIKTPYYTATVPIWVDQITTPTTWADDFLLPEAKEVLSVLGGFIVVIKKPIDESGFEKVKELLEAVGKVVRDGCGGSGYGGTWDGVAVVVGMGNGMAGGLEREEAEWEDVCADEGFEWVDWEKKGRNEFHGEFRTIYLRRAVAFRKCSFDVIT